MRFHDEICIRTTRGIKMNICLNCGKTIIDERADFVKTAYKNKFGKKNRQKQRQEECHSANWIHVQMLM